MNRFLKTLLFGIILIYSTHNYSQNTKSVQEILSTYIEAYKEDVTLKSDVTFGVKVDDEFWHIEAKPKNENKKAEVLLKPGAPKVPTFYFNMKRQTLDSVYTGKINSLTASVKAFSFENAPLELDFMEGFQPDQSTIDIAIPLLFHFWNTGKLETIPYGLKNTRHTHGAQAAIFYYQPGFRSGYTVVLKGQHANKDKRSQSNPFPSLFVVIGGKGTMRISGKDDFEISKGESILIPAGTRHEVLNENDTPLEMILLMFGKGA